MSDGSNISQKILTEPLKNIGAQDILQVGSTYEGVLRKKGGRFGGILGSSKWKQRFVVISQGCIYCFKDEYASRPQSAFSLAVYESVNETACPNMLHCFEIKHEDVNCPPQLFAAETDAKTKLWVGYIQDAITQTHQHSGGSPSGSDEGISMAPRRKRIPAPLPPLPPTPNQEDETKYKHVSKSEYSLESDDDDVEEHYDDVNEPDGATSSRSPYRGQQSPKSGIFTEAKSHKNIPGAVSVLPFSSELRKSVSSRPKIDLPPTPNQQQQKSQRQSSVTSHSGLPDYVNEEVFKEEDYTFASKDKERAHSLLRQLPTGTFLVRYGNTTRTVLSVKTDIGVKEFQITENGSKVSIDRKTMFPSMSTLLCYYNQNFLPKQEYQVKLKKGYNT